MQDKKMKSLDNYGRYTLYGVFLECQDDMNACLVRIPKKDRGCIKIRYRVFSLVISLYLKKMFALMIDGYTATLLNKFGELLIVKTRLVRYAPKKWFFYKDKEGNLIRVYDKIKRNSPYWYFVFWSSPKKLRHYRFHIDIKYKKMFMENVNRGIDYVDYTLNEYGMNASENYIHHIK